MIRNPIYGKIKTVPNHQPGMLFKRGKCCRTLILYTRFFHGTKMPWDSLVPMEPSDRMENSVKQLLTPFQYNYHVPSRAPGYFGLLAAVPLPHNKYSICMIYVIKRHRMQYFSSGSKSARKNMFHIPFLQPSFPYTLW